MKWFLLLFISVSLFAAVSFDSDVTGVGGSVPLTTKGDLVGYSTEVIRLPVGSNAQCLVADSTEAAGIKWGSCASGSSPLTTKGDLFTYTTVDARLAVGSNGLFLKANSGAATGLEWSSALQGTLAFGTSQTPPGLGLANPSSSDQIHFYTSTTDQGSISQTGLWTIGASGGTETHSIVGNVSVSGLTASELVVTNGSKVLTSVANVSAAEAGTLDGATGSLCGVAQSCTLTNKAIDADDNTIADIDNSEIKAAAGIAVNKLAALTASRAVVTDGSGFLAAATTTATEIGYVNGVTSAIQTQLNGKLPSTGVGLVEAIQVNIDTATAREYVVLTAAPFACTINTIKTDCASGSITSFDVEINGTNVTGMAAIDMTTTLQTDTASAANAVAENDRVTINVNTVSSPDKCEATIKCTR